MNRQTFNAMVDQYAVKDVSGEGAVSWDQGAHCVMPDVVIGGKAVQDGTPTPDAPVTPVFSKGTEVVCRGKNLFNPNTLIVGRISAADFDTVFDDNDAFRTIKMWLPAGTYTLAFSEKCFIIRKYLDGNLAGISISTVSHTFTSAADGMVGFSFRQDPQPEHWDANVKVWLVKGEATPYEPYFDGGTAVAPELLAIPGTEYRDEWNPQTGKGICRCAVIESYAGETIETPYISSTGELSEGAYVIYGIADTPFETDPQPLIQPKGTGQIIQTGGSLDGCPITVKCVTHS